jgi:hypothetical protein
MASRKVRSSGAISWNDRALLISKSLAGWNVGLQSDGQGEIELGPVIQIMICLALCLERDPRLPHACSPRLAITASASMVMLKPSNA